MVVVTIIAIATAGVSFALRDSSSQALERDAQRLIAQLESARALSRTSGQPVLWRAQAGGYRFEGSALAKNNSPQTWLTPAIEVQGPTGTAPVLLLGPEPLLPAQAVTLRLASASLRIASDGLRPFAVEAAP